MAERAYFADGGAVVLCGGKSSRMGRPKALLPFAGEPLVVHIVRALGRLFPEVVVVAAPGEQFDALSGLLVSSLNQPNQAKIKLARDEVAYQGPVGGIYYGLGAAAGDYAFVTSCDAAFLNPALVEYLVRQLPGHDVVVPHWDGRFQPLHAVYRKSVAPLLKIQLERGELRPIFLYDKVPTRQVAEEEIRRFDPEGWGFFNMNRPEDYAAALEHWDARRRVETETEKQKGGSGAVSVPVPISVPVSISVSVELFGVPRLLAKRSEVPLSLPEKATLADVFAALAESVPVLAGLVVAAGGALTRGYACNVNGLDFVRDPAAVVHAGDRIFILAADAGG